MKCLNVLFFYGLLAVGFSFDYDATPMEDPLQPIWHRLESLSQGILEGFQEQMTKFLQETHGNIDTKFQDIRSELNRTGPASSGRDTSSLVNEVKEAVTDWIEDFYQSTIRKENEAAIAKAEGSIKVRIDALENKLVEHINVKIAALVGTGGTTESNSSIDVATVVHKGSQLSELETKITSHITTKLTNIENSISHQLGEVSLTMTASSLKLTTINTHVTKITEELSDITGGTSSTSLPSGGSSENCRELVAQVGAMMNGSQLTTDFLEQQETRWREMQSVIADVRDTPSYLPRDCSDIHWLHHEASSGVYQIYPSLDRKVSVSVWCDMAENGDKADGGWTVILRRRETEYGHLDFNRTWEDYANGFGDPAEGEWWFSLISLHALTYRQPYAVRILITDIEGQHFVADYSNFRVEDQTKKFRLIVDGFSGNVTVDAFKSKHHGRSFSTPDQDNDNWAAGSCALSNGGGWWFNACHYTTLTAPFPTSEDRDDKTIRWMNGETWLVLNDVTMEIRPVEYGKGFDAHGLDESQ